MRKRLFPAYDGAATAPFVVATEADVLFRTGDDAHGGMLCKSDPAGDSPYAETRIFCRTG